MNTTQTTAKLIARAVSKGHNEAEATSRLAELTAALSPVNLACALAHWGYATERQAERVAAHLAA